MRFSFQPLLLALTLQAAACTAATPPVSAPTAELAVDREPIHEEGFVPIGGIPQWVTIRGDRRDNPAVLFLHGGPGNTLSPFSAALYGSWEKDFTIVQWDQRGAGRTFGRTPATAEAKLAVERMTADGMEIAEYLARRLGQPKIVLVAGSWGTVLGVRMAKAWPDLFHAYIGVGQLVSYRDNQAASYSKIVALARAAGDSATLSAIESLGPPPWTNPRNFGILRRATRKYEAQRTVPPPASWWQRSATYSTPQMLADYEAGEDYSYLQFVGMEGDGMFSGVDLPRLGTRFELPVFLVQGEEDLVTVPAVAKAYFHSILAPRKGFVLLPATGHDPNPVMMDAIHKLLETEVPRR